MVEARTEGKARQLLRNVFGEVPGGVEYNMRSKTRARPPSAEATKVIHPADACTKKLHTSGVLSDP